VIQITKDKKSPTWIITKTDDEGFHSQIHVTGDELVELARIIMLDYKNL